MKRYILTGTPGCGKTSIIRGLEMSGASVVAESATDVIAYKQMQGESAHGKNLILSMILLSYKNIDKWIGAWIIPIGSFMTDPPFAPTHSQYTLASNHPSS